MRAQATMEFLMVFLVTIAFIAIIATALVVSGDGAKEQSETIERIIAVEEVTRSVEVLTNSGIAMVFGAEGMEVEIEKEYVHVGYKGKKIEAEGVFDGYWKKGQPV